MHESRVVMDILAEVERVAILNDAGDIDVVRIEIGALSHVTPEGFNGHFGLVSEGTAAAKARLDITKSEDRDAPDALAVRLVSIVAGGR